MIPVTQQAHALVQSAVRGHLAIDATAGNGHDTEFLAQLVGPQGRVWAFDIQPEALATTTNRLHGRMIPVELRLKAAEGESAAFLDSASQGGPQVVCIEASHAEMSDHLPLDCRGQIAVIMFNLGYLPGADKSCITLAESTLPALHASLEWLAVGGMLTVVAYPGHPGGDTESEAVREWFNDRSAEEGYEVLSEIAPSRHQGPRLFALRRVK